MTTLAVQGAVGGIGSKATTELSYSFSSMSNAGEYQYGVNKNGIYRLNTGETDDENDYTRTFTLATASLGEKGHKQGRMIYVGVEATEPFTVSISFDEQTFRNYTATPSKTGLQTVRIPIGKNQRGKYVTVKVTSTDRFRIDSISGLFIVRPIATRGY